LTKTKLYKAFHVTTEAQCTCALCSTTTSDCKLLSNKRTFVARRFIRVQQRSNPQTFTVIRAVVVYPQLMETHTFHICCCASALNYIFQWWSVTKKHFYYISVLS